MYVYVRSSFNVSFSMTNSYFEGNTYLTRTSGLLVTKYATFITTNLQNNTFIDNQGNF